MAYGNELPHTGVGTGNLFLAGVGLLVTGIGALLARVGLRKSRSAA